MWPAGTARQEILTGKIMTVDDVTLAIEKITLEDIKRVAQDLFKTARLNLAAVGPIKEQTIPLDSLNI